MADRGTVAIGTSVFRKDKGVGEHVDLLSLLGDVEASPEQIEAWKQSDDVPSLLSDFVEDQLECGSAVRRDVIEDMIRNAAALTYLIATLQLEGEPRSLFWIIENVPGISSGKQLQYGVASLGMSKGLLDKTVDSEGTPFFFLTDEGKRVDTEALIGVLASKAKRLEGICAGQQAPSLAESLAEGALGSDRAQRKSPKKIAFFVFKIIVAVVVLWLLLSPLVTLMFNRVVS